MKPLASGKLLVTIAATLTIVGTTSAIRAQATRPVPPSAHVIKKPNIAKVTTLHPAATPTHLIVPTSPETIESSVIHDLTATLEVDDDETNFEELKKIGGAFATTYRISRTVNLTYEYPNKARFEGHALGAAISLIYNGTQKAYHTPIKSSVMDVSTQPGQKQSLMDLGIFARDYLATDYKPNFVRKEGALLVYKLTQRNSTNGSNEIVWVNPLTAITEKRMSYNGDGKLTKELRYLKPQMVRKGVYVPTRIEVYNQFGKLGAVQNVTEIKVNLGVDEDLFNVS